MAHSNVHMFGLIFLTIVEPSYFNHQFLTSCEQPIGTSRPGAVATRRQCSGGPREVVGDVAEKETLCVVTSRSGTFFFFFLF